MSRRLLIAACCCIALGVAAALPAAADGPPQGISEDGAGITSPDGTLRYLAVDNGSKTLLEALHVRGGTLMNSVWLKGAFGIPAIAWTADGLTANGKTLVLTTYPWIGSRATFLVVRVPDFTTVAVVKLKNKWSYDAISPDGRTLYLIQGFPGRYLVRAYDLRQHRLLKRVIADRRERGPMEGAPITRATTRDGRWAYTLYVRGNNTAFVHALDTVGRQAVCIDLPWKDVSGWIWDARLRLSRDGRKLTLKQLGGRHYAFVDTRSWKVTR
jgi:hypothetical protein